MTERRDSTRASRPGGLRRLITPVPTPQRGHTDRLELAKVGIDDRLVDAMWALDRGTLEIALVTDSDGRLAGILTDGDVRRALLGGAPLEAPLAPFVTREFIRVLPGASRMEVVELMQARKITQIPIVHRNGTLIGLHLLHDVIGPEVRPNWAVVMAGGKGTRLRPLTENVPKPMIKVAGRPILERVLLHLVSHGIRRVFFAINYLGHMVEEHFGNGRSFGCQIEYLRETVPLDTGGALSILPELPSRPVLVMNGDLVTQADLGAMLDHHERAGDYITVGTKKYLHTVPYGCVEQEGDRILQLREKPTLIQRVNAGIYVLSPSAVAEVPDQAISLPALIDRAMGSSHRIGAFAIEDDWIDVGQREQLDEAQHGGMRAAS